jgi:neutral ceramidase
MKRHSMKRKAANLDLRAVLGCALLGMLGAYQPAAMAAWKAGVARAVITPKQPMWMAGYAARTKPSEGAVHDLWAKGLAFEDPAGRRAVIITLDLCGIDRDLSVRIRDSLQIDCGLGRERIVLACSHTHSGPVVGTNLLTMYKIDDAERRRIADYAHFLEKTVANVAKQALDHLQTAQLSWATGRCDFAVNRRNNKEADVPALRAQLAIKGPVDHDLPVLRVARADGSIVAIVFGYACHCTVLDFYQFCGDYAGFAQLDLEARFPGAQAMFVAGCGGDQNPIPRRKLELAERYGKELAACTALALAAPMRPIEKSLEASYEEIPLAFDKLPTRDQIQKETTSDNFYIASRARLLLKKTETKGALETTYPYPIQVWQLGDLHWVFLGGEVVVDYSSRLKLNLGSSCTWVSAYCNDVMAYIPSLRVLKEGGYEGATAMVYYGQPAPWSQAVEESIINAVARGIKVVRREHPSATADHPPAAR